MTEGTPGGRFAEVRTTTLNRYLPASVRLPFGYLITVKVVSARTLKKISDGSEVMGLWDGSSRTIYIDRNLEEREQRYTLTHEMIHAFADWQHHALGE
jgi:Zn-dependent peptidase ImmA (M78 family)